MPRRWLAGWQNPENNEPAIYVNTSDTCNKGLGTKRISDFPETTSRKLDSYYNLRRRKYLMLKNQELHITSYQQLAPYWRQLENWRGEDGSGGAVGWSRGVNYLQLFLRKKQSSILLPFKTVISINIWKLKRKVLIVLRPKSAELEQNFAGTF